MKSTLRNIMLASAAGLVLAACSQGSEIISPGLSEVVIDTTAPTVTFSPTSITVNSGETATSTLAATDNVGVTSGPTATCSRGSFAGNTYTAPNVSVNTDTVCTATASDAAGNTGTATLNISIIAPDTTAPVVTFSPSALTVESGGTAMSTLTAVDTIDGSITPTVSCTNGGAFANDTFTAPNVTSETISICTATATDSESNTGTGTLSVTVTAAAAGTCSSNGTATPLGDTVSCDEPLGNLASFNGTLTESATIPFREGVVYELTGRLDIGADGGSDCTGVTPVVLTIEPGVTLVADSGADYIVVNRCHQINAAGTAGMPIIMTSKNDITQTGDRANAIGEWGGLVVLGEAPINRCAAPGATGGTTGCENTIEGVTLPDAFYGGADDNDDSGTLQYVQVRHAGFEVAPNIELNGITFGGVGAGTTVDHIQVHNNSDDGVEFFGGNVDVKYVALTGNDDEQLDTDNGYQGNIQYVVARQRGGDSSDNGIEASSVEPGATPLSNATVSNFTFLGANNTDSNGIRLNTGTVGTYLNGIVTDGNSCLDYEDDAGDGTVGFTPGSDPAFQSVLFDCVGGLLTSGGDADPTTGQAAFDANPNNLVATNTLSNDFFPGPVELGVTAQAAPNGFFDPVNYIGAFSDAESTTDNWATGWTQDLFADPVCPTGTTDAGFEIAGQGVCNIGSEADQITVVTDTLRLTRGNVYRLTNRVDIGIDVGADGSGGDPAELIVESGVTLFGNNGADHIVVNRGSQIFVNGTRSNPVVFTSEADVTNASGDRVNAIGEWGGLVILGRAPINRCATPGATGGTNDCENTIEGVTNPDAFYGGSTADDDSGALRFFQLKYAGFELATNVELNGITLGGVGNGTDIEYVQVHNNSDDGIEFFGGTANARYVVVTGNDDEQLDTDNGYNGSVQFAIGIQRDGDSSDNGIEASSVEPGVMPLSNAVIANFTLLGANNTDSNGIRLNTGTVGTYANGVLTDGNACLDYEDDAGDGNVGFTAGSDPAFQSVLFDCTGGLLTSGGDADPTTGQAAVDADPNNLVATNTLTGTFVNGATENGVPAATLPSNGFLEQVSYIGAVQNADDTWWQGWSCGLEVSDPC